MISKKYWGNLLTPPLTRNKNKNIISFKIKEMISQKERNMLFIFGCLGVRSLFAYSAKISSPKILKIYASLAIFVAFVWIYLFVTNSRQTGMEAGGRIWWNNIRPVHAILYLCFAYSALRNDRNAYLFLVADVVLGAVAFLDYRIF